MVGCSRAVVGVGAVHATEIYEREKRERREKTYECMRFYMGVRARYNHAGQLEWGHTGGEGQDFCEMSGTYNGIAARLFPVECWHSRGS